MTTCECGREIDPWPSILTARELSERRILPISEESIRALAKRAGVGRLLGRTYVFEPADVRALLDSLPCPSGLPQGSQQRSDGISRSPNAALAKALELNARWTKGSRRKSP